MASTPRKKEVHLFPGLAHVQLSWKSDCFSEVIMGWVLSCVVRAALASSGLFALTFQVSLKNLQLV